MSRFDTDLIEYVSRHKCIWDTQNVQYKDKVAKENAWETVSIFMECSGNIFEM